MKRSACHLLPARGFSLIELLISLAILGLLAGMAAPLMELTHKRQQEQELRAALQEIRQAIDAYKQATDEGRIERKADATGYPPSLEVLYKGVEEVAGKNAGGRNIDLQKPEKPDEKKKKKIFFLRRLPRDPFYPDPEAKAEDTWGKRSYESEYDEPKAGKDVYDVYSLSPDNALNGTPYREW